MKSTICRVAMLLAFGTPVFASVNVTSPANGSTVSSPVKYVATATSTCAKGVSSMGVYVNNQRVVVQNGASLSDSLTLSNGTYDTVVQEWDACGGSTTEAVKITVNGQSGTSTAVVVSSPVNNSTVSSPVTFSAKATTAACAKGIAAIGVYVDNALAYKINGAVLQTSLAIKAGPESTVVQAWDNCGGAIKTPVKITVQAATATAVHISASPASISSGSSSVLSVTASNATQVVITGSNGTSYTLATSGGQETVSPTATTTYTATATGASGKVTATAVVTVAATKSTVTIAANPAFVVPGGSSVLNVVATNSTQVTVAGSDGSSYTLASTGGSQTVTPKATTTYTATATGADGTATAQTSVTVTTAVAGIPVLMHHNDLAGDGANLNEVTLTTANVTATKFGKRFALPVDGQIYAQPLYVPGLMVNGAAHNTVFTATQNDSVYAFDSDTGSQLWKVSLGTPLSTDDPDGVQSKLGILSTPVIDASSNTMYVAAENTGSVLKLHALDITTGAEKFGGPVKVTASAPGTGSGSSDGKVPLSAGCYQRPALILANGQVYLGFGHCDHGWMLAYDAGTLVQTHVLNTSPDGVGATIWMAGAGPVVDSNGDLYVITGDDIGTSAPTAEDFPDAFLKLSPSLQVLDYMIPSDERYLESNDADLGSGSAILMPGNDSASPNELIGGGKDGRVFVVNRDSMGGYHADPNGQNDNVQTIQTGTQEFNNVWGAPAFWNGLLYFHTDADVLRSYAWNAPGSAGLLSGHSADAGNIAYSNHGASPSVSANGTSNAIVWDIDDSGFAGGTPAVLHAYSASNVSQELYSSAQAANGRDTAGHAGKFSVPTVSGGKVFVPTSTELDIYGLLP
jgi:hypothetical protein